MKVLLLCAKGFEFLEFSAFTDVLGWAKNELQQDIAVVTCGFTREVQTSFYDIPVVINKLISEIEVDDYDALAIPGGFEEYGFYEEAFDPAFLAVIQEFEKSGKFIATICVAALAAGKAGILKNRGATTYHLGNGHRQKQLKEYCNKVLNQPIVVDRKVVTSYCPETAVEVAFLLLAYLTNENITEDVRYRMGY